MGGRRSQLAEDMRGVAIEHRHTIHRHGHFDVGFEDLVEFGTDLLLLPADARDDVPRDFHRVEAAEPRPRERLQGDHRRRFDAETPHESGRAPSPAPRPRSSGWRRALRRPRDHGCAAIALIASPLTSGMISGVSARIRCAEAFVHTTCPERARANSVSFATAAGSAESTNGLLSGSPGARRRSALAPGGGSPPMAHGVRSRIVPPGAPFGTDDLRQVEASVPVEHPHQTAGQRCRSRRGRQPVWWGIRPIRSSRRRPSAWSSYSCPLPRQPRDPEVELPTLREVDCLRLHHSPADGTRLRPGQLGAGDLAFRGARIRTIAKVRTGAPATWIRGEDAVHVLDQPDLRGTQGITEEKRCQVGSAASQKRGNTRHVQSDEAGKHDRVVTGERRADLRRIHRDRIGIAQRSLRAYGQAPRVESHGHAVPDPRAPESAVPPTSLPRSQAAHPSDGRAMPGPPSGPPPGENRWCRPWRRPPRRPRVRGRPCVRSSRLQRGSPAGQPGPKSRT